MAHFCDGQGDRSSATKYYQMAVDMYRQLGDQWALSHPLCDLAWKTWDLGETRKALQLMEEYVLSLRQLRSNMPGLAMALYYVATMRMATGDFQSAWQYLTEKREIEHSFGGSLAEAAILADSAAFDFSQGNLPAARQKMDAALELARQKSDQLLLTWMLFGLGRVLAYEGCAREATAILTESLSTARAAGLWDPYGIPEIQLEYAHAAFLNGDLPLALHLTLQSLAGVRDSLPRLPAHFEQLAAILITRGEALRAARLLGSAQHMREAMGLPLLPVLQPGYNQMVSNLQNQLRESEFQQAWQAGAGMTGEESVAFALAA